MGPGGSIGRKEGKKDGRNEGRKEESTSMKNKNALYPDIKRKE